MKRDLGLMRKVILTHAYCLKDEIEIKGIALLYHRDLCFEAGYLKEVNEISHGLTFQGWEVADLIADGDLWSAAKEIVAESGLETVPFGMMLEIMQGLVRRRLKKDLGSVPHACRTIYPDPYLFTTRARGQET